MREGEWDKYGTIWHLVVYYVCKICRIHNKKIEIKLKSYMECYTAAHTLAHTTRQREIEVEIKTERAYQRMKSHACKWKSEWVRERERKRERERERERDVCSISVDNLSPRRVYWFLVSIKSIVECFSLSVCLLLLLYELMSSSLYVCLQVVSLSLSLYTFFSTWLFQIVCYAAHVAMQNHAKI